MMELPTKKQLKQAKKQQTKEYKDYTPISAWHPRSVMGPSVNYADYNGELVQNDVDFSQFKLPTYVMPSQRHVQPADNTVVVTNATRPVRAPSTTDGENVVSKFFRPREDELDAARNGMRWHWALENRPMIPGSKFNETVWQGVDRENSWLASLLRQQKAAAQPADNRFGQVASERQRATMTNQWNKFLDDMHKGHWDNYGRTYEEAMQWGERFRQRYQDVFGSGTDIDLRPAGTSMGANANLERKVNTDMREILYNTSTVTDKINQWVADGDFDNPAKSRLIRNELDKIAQNLSATLGGDSKNMADAEKVRIQILYLPEEAYDSVIQTVMNYRRAMKAVMASASAKQMSQSQMGAFKQVEDALTGTEMTGNEDKGTVGNLMAQVTGVVRGKLPELPTDLAVDLKAVQDSYDDYMDKTVLAANVDPAVAYHIAKYLHDMFKTKYNAEMELINRPFDKWEKSVDDADYSRLSKAVPADRVFEPLTFNVPSLARVPGGKASGNPQSTGEQQSPKDTPKREITTPIKGF